MWKHGTVRYVCFPTVSYVGLQCKHLVYQIETWFVGEPAAIKDTNMFTDRRLSTPARWALLLESLCFQQILYTTVTPDPFGRISCGSYSWYSSGPSILEKNCINASLKVVQHNMGDLVTANISEDRRMTLCCTVLKRKYELETFKIWLTGILHMNHRHSVRNVRERCSGRET